MKITRKNETVIFKSLKAGECFTRLSNAGGGVYLKMVRLVPGDPDKANCVKLSDGLRGYCREDELVVRENAILTLK